MFQKIWLKLHHILGHPSFALTRQLAISGWFGPQALGLSQLPLSDAPMCEACKYGKQTRKSDGTTVTSCDEILVGLKTELIARLN